MTRAYSFALKQQMIARLTGVNALSAAQLARETGITQQNLSRWLSEARSMASVSSDSEIGSAWTVEQKARTITEAAALTNVDLSQYLERVGVRFTHFRRWRLALEEAGEESVGMTKRIRQLERELARKERALAEAATLLVLRESIDSVIERNAADTDSEIEEEETLSCSM